MKKFIITLTVLCALLIGCSAQQRQDTIDACNRASTAATVVATSPVAPPDWRLIATGIAGGLSLAGNVAQAYDKAKKK